MSDVIPRRIKKYSLSPLTVIALLAGGTLAILVFTLPAPLWARVGMALFVVSLDLLLVFGRLHGRPVWQVMLFALRYVMRPRQRVWARERRRITGGKLQAPADRWWKWAIERVAAITLPSRRTVAAALTAALIILAAGGLLARQQGNVGQEVTVVAAPSTEKPPASVSASPMPSLVPTFTPVPSPVPTVFPGPASPLWQGGARPGYLRLRAPGRAEVTLVFVDFRATYTYTLTMDKEILVPVYPIFQPYVREVRVWSSGEIAVEQWYHKPYSCPSAQTWWLLFLMDQKFAPRYLEFYPHREAGKVTIRYNGKVFSGWGGQRKRLVYPGPGSHVYRLEGERPFCLETWLFQY